MSPMQPGVELRLCNAETKQPGHRCVRKVWGPEGARCWRHGGERMPPSEMKSRPAKRFRVRTALEQAEENVETCKDYLRKLDDDVRAAKEALRWAEDKLDELMEATEKETTT